MLLASGFVRDGGVPGGGLLILKNSWGPVSTPLQWSEVVPKLDPLAFTLDTLRKRLDRYGDLWEKALPSRGRCGVAGPEVAKL
jgi:hypothetical protein